MEWFLGIPAQGRYALGSLGFLGSNGAEFSLVIGHGLGQHREQVLGMGGRDRDDRLCPRLVYLRQLVEEEERELVFLVRDLDHVAVHGIECLRDIDGNFLSGHGDQVRFPVLSNIGSGSTGAGIFQPCSLSDAG